MHYFAALLAVFTALASPFAKADTTQSVPISIEVFRETPLSILQVGDLAGDGFIKSMTRAEGPIPKEVSASRQLAEALKVELEKRSMALGEVPENVLPQKRGRSVSGDSANSLQIFTDYNAISYLPFHWSTYQYGMKGRARLIDGNGKTIWEKKCYIKHTKADPRFQITHDGFDSEGRRIHEVVQAATQECARLIAQQV